MPTVEQCTDPYISTYTPVPHVGVGICEVCHFATGTRSDGSRNPRCGSCYDTTRLAHSLRLVVPITLYEGQSQLHTVLRGYKDSPDEEARDRLTLQVAALIARFLRDHGDCIRASAERDWDTLTIVPSLGGRTGVHPLENAVLMARDHPPLYVPLLERTGVALGRREANAAAYAANRDADGRNVLIIDDTFTSGSHVQSAAAALAAGGATVVGALVVGRYVRPDYSDETRALWDAQRGIPFDFGRCCLE